MSDVIYSPSVNSANAVQSAGSPAVSGFDQPFDTNTIDGGVSYSGDNYDMQYDLSPVLNGALNMYYNNNKMYAERATSANSFQKQLQKDQQRYNQIEAEANRNWQEYMSNSAHQREVADLIKAGLNPVLSALNGQGATTPVGSTASSSQGSSKMAGVDSNTASLFTAMISLISTMVNSATSYDAAIYKADKDFEASRYAADSSAYAQTHNGIYANTARSLAQLFLEPEKFYKNKS